MDNIAPSLFGGLVLTVGIDHPRVKQIPVPAAVRAVVVHPHMFLATTKARAILKGNVTMSDFVWQTANLAGFISGCYTDDLDMIRASLEDVVIEPQRQALIPGFLDVRRGAMEAGALGCSISGAGPSMFAWADAASAPQVEAAMQRGLRARSRSSAIPGSSTSTRPAPGSSGERGSGAGRHAVRKLARRGGHALPSVQRCSRDSRPTAACTCRSPGQRCRCRPSTVRRHLPVIAARLMAPFAAGDALAPAGARHRHRGVQLPGAAGEPHR